MAQTTVNGLTVYTPQPTGDAGLAIDNNFRELADRVPVPAGPVPRYSVVAQLDATATGDTNVYTLPGGFYWKVESIEVTCKSISGSGNPPTMRFGLSTDTDNFAEIEIDATSALETITLRNLGIDVIASTNILSTGVATASTYSTHVMLVTFNLVAIEDAA